MYIECSSLGRGPSRKEQAVAKKVFVVLIGDGDGKAVDLYQELQERDALAEGRAAGHEVEVVWATSFDQYGAVRKRLAASPVDAVVAEPASIATASLILKNLQGRTGIVLLNAWDPTFEPCLGAWGAGLPAGTISQPQRQIGEVQGRQLSAAMPPGAHVLVVTGPSRSSAARERLEGLRSTVRPDVTLHTTEAGQWSETDGILAFNSWYGVFKARREEIHAIAGQSDDLAVGAAKGGTAAGNPEHARMFGRALLFGVGGCPGYGKELVDAGKLRASVTVRPNAGMAIALLKRFWADGKPLPARAISEAVPYPVSSAGAVASSN
jgi:ABC-type sugar transport system substrate-binding protein